jgi:replicative DNA helicase/DNA primase catalytic subunit
MDETYVRLQNTVNDTGILIPSQDFENENKLKDYIKGRSNSDWYTSLFYFEKEAKEYFEKNNKSIKGYDGPAYTTKLIFDFDSKEDVEMAKQDAIRLLEELQTQGINVVESTRVFFSGNKGFHVELYTTKKFTPEECKNISLYIKRALNLQTLDTVIYNTTRLYRINNTLNIKSGLYKIELEPEDLLALSVEQIRERARKQVHTNVIIKPTNNLEFINSFKIISSEKVNQISVETEEIDGVRGLDTIDYSKCPRTTPICIYSLSHGIMRSGVGERSNIFLRLSAYYRNQGLSKEVVHHTLKGIAELNAKLYPEHPPFPKEEIWTTVNSAFNDNYIKAGSWGTDPNNEILKKYCDLIRKHTDKKCCMHSKVDNSQSIVQIEDVSNSFQKFAENFDRNTVKTGIDHIDKYMNLAVGTTTLLVGATGSGKTTVGLNIMENANALGQYTMFFSLDMHKNLVYLKLAQKLTNYTQEQIISFYRNKDQAKINMIRETISDKYGKTYFDFTSTMTLEQMRDKIFNQEEQYGKKIKLVVCDYAGRIAGPFSDRYANATYNALKSTEIAAVTDAAWIFISQISRNVGDGCTPLRTKRAAKESGDWEESATNVITMWRPFMGDPQRDDVIRMYLAKNRMGKELEAPLYFDGAKGIVRDMTLQEIADYTEVREKEEKEFLKTKFSKI